MSAATKLPDAVRTVIAKAMGYNDESSLYYWGTGGAAKRFDDTIAALERVWPDRPDPKITSIGSGAPPKTGGERALVGLLTGLRVEPAPGGYALTVLFGRGESAQGAAIAFMDREPAPEVAYKLEAIARNIGAGVKP